MTGAANERVSAASALPLPRTAQAEAREPRAGGSGGRVSLKEETLWGQIRKSRGRPLPADVGTACGASWAPADRC